ncbi:hypothetical protein [Oceanihabitans sediminis]|uniref:hypothetical protein n=1 Tax=Oceanihabitans sediminis TaxID=1812012 RepID=UPI00299E2A70|nr:hypothetical protein [Oceanihabitans sediminis]MDX1772977.1 hypothetical protein [Oceanihabitans sediminis]
MKKLILVILVMLAVSCKNDKNQNINEEQKTKQTENSNKEVVLKEDNILTVTMSVKVLEDDKFELYYVDDSIDRSFNSEDRIAVYVQANNNFQTIEFKLPEYSLPYKFRIDLGDNSNKHESNVEIKSVTLQLNQFTIDIDDATMDSFFQPNKYLQKINGGYTRKIVDNKYDPFLLAKPVLIKKIELEF